MNYLRLTTSTIRKTILLGWAVAVIWIYLGNLVNFHQYRIWGKQLIPVACSSTRVKEKDDVSFVKNDPSSKFSLLSPQFDFTAPADLVLAISYFELINSKLIFHDTPLLHQGIQAYSLRGPPSA